MSTILEEGFNIQLGTKASHVLSGESDVCYHQQPFCTESFSTGQKEGPNTRAFRDVTLIRPPETYSNLVSEKGGKRCTETYLA